MPTKILDLDLEQLPAAVPVPGAYPRALVLLRWRGTPVGQVVLPVRDGQVTRSDLFSATADRKELWERVDQLVLYQTLNWDEVDVDLPTPGPATVAVCTRDRPEDIQRCLEALLSLPDDGQEYLVIDNCPSTDETQQVVAAYGDRVRYVREERPGLDVARNRALKEARHAIIAFNDDDAVPDPGWLRGLLRNFRDPQVLCVTGLTMPLELETPAQEWFERYSPFQRGFLRKVHHPGNLHPLDAGKAGAGANMAVRRSLVDLVGPFEEALDGGTATKSGGDTEMFYRILANGYRIVYDPAALSWHKHRLSWEDLCRTVYGYGVGVYAVFTRNLVESREFAVLLRAFAWLYCDQFPNLVRGLRRDPDSLPLELAIAELKGCFAGMPAYLAAKRKIRTETKQLVGDVPLTQHHYSNP